MSSRHTKCEEAELIHSLTIIDVIESAEDLSISAVTIQPKVEANLPHEDYKQPSYEVSTTIKCLTSAAFPVLAINFGIIKFFGLFKQSYL